MTTYISENSKSFKWFILGTATFVTMLYAMAVTIAAIALPDMRGTMAATQDQITWAITGNIVATAIFTPLAGWLAARYEIRKILLFSVIGFMIATFICGISDTLEEIVLARFAQGAFGAPLPPLCQTLVLGAFPSAQRTMAMAVWGMGTILGPVIAPTLGGYLGELLNWRWVFYTLIPFCIVALLMVIATVPIQKNKTKELFDWIGFVFLAIAVASLQIMLDRGERNGWFDSTETYVQFFICIFSFYIFLAHSFTFKKPFINLKIFLNYNYTLGLILIFFFGMLNFVPVVIFPTILQELKGYPQSIIGILMGTRGLGTFLGFFIIALIGRLDPRFTLTTAFSLQAYAGWYMSTFNIDMTFYEVGLASFIQGIGVGMAWPPISVLTFATIDNKYYSEATAMFHLIRNLASSIFIACCVAVVLHTGQINFGQISSLVTNWNEGIMFNFARENSDNFSQVTIANLTKELNRQSLMIGYINAFKLFTWVSLLTIPFLFLIKKNKDK